MNARTLSVTWCDDIRHEVGNKLSFMGVYTGGLVVPTLPTTLPRLCAWFTATAPVSEPFNRIAAKIIRDDGFILGHTPEVKVQPLPSNLPDGRNIQSLNGGLFISPLDLVEKCRYVQLIVTTESDELTSAKLWIEANPELLKQSGVQLVNW
ncbi:hypothetical protein [Steroidobacter sp.]|uniref:hypothetical protein n=1 Tax=Steroidobacter sp. TaxID=1978227 RepID=UPI001A3EDEE6|nr:hypothetical protein [Steroidobacter sp.]MBL8268045.1 hypothetical protein [Steroidobacter sp.]